MLMLITINNQSCSFRLSVFQQLCHECVVVLWWSPETLQCRLDTCSLLHLHQNKGSSLAGRVHLPVSLHPGVAVGSSHDLVRHVLPANENKASLQTGRDSITQSKGNILLGFCPQWRRLRRLLQVFLDLGVVVAPSNQPLGGVQRVLGVGDGLPLGRHAHQALAIGGEGDD